jgi:hypothetical protein
MQSQQLLDQITVFVHLLGIEDFTSVTDPDFGQIDQRVHVDVQAAST